ncbi:MAG: DeoR family transcriptional regulator, glycerol-3-phosphate regulon repressor [Rhodobacteraceae bacterium HLUCCO07]|nr:MAG: DeoR family transcriptional regulator, glycerol-3-phosphate regulon repressor [Rhodobacteraceae bacterium HLUCCO07]
MDWTAIRLSDRQRDMLCKVQDAQHVSIERLAEIYGVSPQTVRRDVNAMCEAGVLRRVHGGVEAPRGDNLGYGARRTLNAPAKRRIAACFAARVEPGLSLAVSIGTTPEFAVQALHDKTDLTVMTNNLNIALFACECEGWAVHIAGGMVRPGDRDVLGSQVEAFFARYQVDIGLFGVAGVDADGTLLDFTEDEVAARMAILRHCRRSVLLLDGSKFGRAAHVRGGHIADVDEVICDVAPPAALAREIAAQGVRFTIAEENA